LIGTRIGPIRDGGIVLAVKVDAPTSGLRPTWTPAARKEHAAFEQIGSGVDEPTVIAALKPHLSGQVR
jgi:hypothetical protein